MKTKKFRARSAHFSLYCLLAALVLLILGSARKADAQNVNGTTYTVSSGTTSFATLEIYNDGTLSQTGGTVDDTTEYIGYSGSGGNPQGTYDQGANTKDITTNLFIGDGTNDPEAGFFETSGTVAVSGTFDIGLNSGYAQVTQNTNSAVTSSSTVLFGYNNGTSYYLMDQNSTFTAPGFAGINGQSNNGNVMDINGGTLVATADNNLFVDGNFEMEVENGGVTFNTNGFNIGVHTTILAGASGVGGVTKTGAGTLDMYGNYTTSSNYYGATVVAAGTLEFDNNYALYEDDNFDWTAQYLIVDPGATLMFNVEPEGSSGIQFQPSDIANFATLGTGTSGFESGSNLGIDTSDNSITLTTGIANPNSGANVLGLTIVGTNSVTMTAASTYTGTTTIIGATLQIDNGGSLSPSGKIVDDGSLVFDLTGTTTQGVAFSSAAITGSGSLTQSGSGTLILNTPSSYSGGTYVTSGTLVLLDTTAAPVIAQNTPITVTNATLLLTGTNFNAISIPSLLTVGPGGVVNADGSVQNAHTLGNTLLEGGVLTSSGPADPSYGNFVLYSSGTLSAMGSVPSVINASVFQLNGVRPIIVGTGTGSTLALLTISSTLENTNSNSILGGVTKSGSGTLVLSGSNTYSAGTTIVQGALLADNTLGSATGTGSVAVGNGAPNSGILGGTGFISGSTSIGAGGTLEPGFGLGTAGSDLTFQGNLSLSSSATVVLNIDPQAHSTDKVTVMGNLALSSNDTLTINLLDAPAPNTQFVIMTYAGSFNGVHFANLDITGLPSGYTLNYTSTPGEIILTIPEPQTWAMLAAGIWMLAGISRSRGPAAK